MLKGNESDTYAQHCRMKDECDTVHICSTGTHNVPDQHWRFCFIILMDLRDSEFVLKR